MSIKSANPAIEFAPDITNEEVMGAVAELMPGIEERFRRLGHREVRVSLFVESMDPLAQPVSIDMPVAMIPLFLKRIA